MTPVLLVWLQFGLCVAMIGVAGTYLSRYGDIIADKTGLGGTWVGLILLTIYLLNSFILYLHG
jgi:cation:H+ antiporter